MLIIGLSLLSSAFLIASLMLLVFTFDVKIPSVSFAVAFIVSPLTTLESVFVDTEPLLPELSGLFPLTVFLYTSTL